MSVRVLAGGLAILVVFAGGTWALASSRDAESQPTLLGSTTSAAAGRPVPAEISDEQRTLAILRHDRTEADALPRTAQAALNAHPTLLGQNPGLSRKALTTATGLTYYVVPANQAVCLDSETGSGACTSIAEVAAGRFIGVEICEAKLPPGEFRVTGMMPDGVDAVVVRYQSGTTRVVMPENNVYSFDAATRGDLPLAVTWTLDGVTQQTMIQVPADIAAGCGPAAPAP